MTIHDALNVKKCLFADGGMGTMLQAQGLKAGEIPELWNISHPDAIRAVHSAYFSAGSDYVCTNTFGANREKYHGERPLGEVVAAAVALAKEAAATAPYRGARTERFVALDVGPTGRLLRSAGDFDAAYEAFAEEIRYGVAAGADLIAIETMSDTYELKAAVLAAKENSSLPVFATVALDEKGKLLTGGDVEAVAALLEGLRVDALGLNCGLGPDRALPFVRHLLKVSSLPVIVKLNAGLPHIENGKTVFDIGPADFAAYEAELVAAGARIAGGCCGTTPDHIAALCAAVQKAETRAVFPCDRKGGVVSSGTHAVVLSTDDTVVIGERINPTGKKKLKQALAGGDIAYVLGEAVNEAEAGAQILDVNVGVPGLDEPALLTEVVEAVQGVTDLPLQIDTSDPVAMERALRHYNGKALINSVNGKEESMAAVLPLVAKYGGLVVALTLDENGIPPTAEGRLAIAEKIIARGAEYGLKPADFVIDVLCLSVSAESQSGAVILKALRLVREKLGLPTILGVSNISFGLPARPLFNAAFYAMALAEGLSAAIINPLSVEMMTTFRASRAVLGRDVNCSAWIDAAVSLPVGESRPAVAKAVPAQGGQDGQPANESPLFAAVRRGLKDEAAAAAKELIAAGASPVAVIDEAVVPALEVIGKGFESGRIFLPQLLMAAEAASAAFEEIRKALPADAKAGRGPVVIATVKGDIHDIGKNIVRALLENYGFEVVDLGRDVPPEKVVETVRDRKAKLVGLSALMTTTTPAMAETIRQIHAAGLDCKVMVGGAVVTAEYAASIGADYYSADAMQSVRIAESLF